MRLVVDLVGLQSQSRFRGIGRYTRGLVQGLLRTAGEHEVWLTASRNLTKSLQDIQSQFNDLPTNSRIVPYRVLDDICQRFPSHAWRRAASELVREHFLADLQADAILFSSMIDGYADDVATSSGTLYSDSVRATVGYDLIPLVSPKHYIRSVELRSWYREKLDDFGKRDIFLAISDFAGRELVDHLGIDPSRITSIMGGADEFATDEKTAEPESGHPQLARLGVSRPFFVYAASFEHRKNFGTLIDAFARFKSQVDQPHQLVLVMSKSKVATRAIEKMVRGAGLSNADVLVTGTVDDADLKQLYRSCVALVYPSLHEGLGLPILEAMHLDAAVIGSNASGIPEIIGLDEALFDPRSADSVAGKMVRVVRDEAFRNRLKQNAVARRSLFTWDKTASTAWRALEKASAAHAASRGTRSSRPERYRTLIAALKRLPASGGSPTENERRALANAIAENLDEIEKVTAQQDDGSRNRASLGA
jgi:glycosyltransferase involved in cell wall biosynthesis